MFRMYTMHVFKIMVNNIILIAYHTLTKIMFHLKSWISQQWYWWPTPTIVEESNCKFLYKYEYERH